MPKIKKGESPKISEKPKKRVLYTSQLGKVQNAILEWLLSRDEEIKSSDGDEDKILLMGKGVRWKGKQVCKVYEKITHSKDYSPSPSTVSSSRRALEERELVVCYGERTTHVKLTDKGRTLAVAKRADPRTEQEKRDEKTYRRKAGAITYDLAQCEEQMSRSKRYRERARLAYYLFCLRDLGQITEQEKQGLANLIGELEETGFEHLLIVLQDFDLSEDEAKELRELYGKLIE